MKAMKCVTLLLCFSLCVPERTTETTQTTDSPAPSYDPACPPTKELTLGICGKECKQDSNCDGDMKCCPDMCGQKSCTKI
ncbi:hypothetical protein GDO81_021274, partial [Engystomops pustulosus]